MGIRHVLDVITRISTERVVDRSSFLLFLESVFVTIKQ